jgi:hypothetical protein
MNPTMKVKKDTEMKLNTTLQMGMRCWRFAGYSGDQIKARALLREEVPEDLPIRKARPVSPDVNPDGVHQPDEAGTTRRHGTRGS